MSQFNRKVTVLVDVFRKIGSEESNIQFEWDSSNVAIEAVVKKSNKPEGNSAQVTLWNISEERAYYISTAVKATITILAGHINSTGTGVLYVGDVTGISPVKQGADIGTVYNLSTGGAERRKGQVTVSLTGQTTTRSIVEQVLEGSGIAANLPEDFVGSNYSRGYADAGNRIRLIQNALKGTGYTFTIEDNILEISTTSLEEGQSIGSTTYVVTLSASSGLIGTPQPKMEQQQKGGLSVGVHKLAGSGLSAQKNAVLTDAGVDTEGDASATTAVEVIAGYEIESLLNPLLRPNGVVLVDSPSIAGKPAFVIDHLTHNIQSHGAQFTTKMMIKRA